MQLIKEGKAIIKIPKLPEKISSDMPVFYNPKMKINRDFTVLILKYLARKLERSLRVADPLAGSGVRSVRILKEVSNIEQILVNDFDKTVVENIKENFQLNKIDRFKYKVSSKEANIFLREERNFDYIDIDPFGSPVPFIESSILSLSKKGILGVTATDTAPLSGTYPDTCIRRYGSKPLRSEFYHEIGIRILIYKIFLTGASFDCSMIPLLSYSYLHHFRIFLLKEKGAMKTTRNIKNNIGFILYCHKCIYRCAAKDKCELEICPRCGNILDYAGPLWIGKINNEEVLKFIEQQAGNDKKLKKFISLLKDESRVNIPFFYTLSILSKVTKKTNVPPIKNVIESVNGVRTHFSGEGFKTHLEFDEVLERFVVL